MEKRALSTLLALALCLSLLPGRALAAGPDLPDWYFLFAVFKSVDADYQKDGGKKHAAYTMTQDEIDFVKQDALDFKAYMDQVGVMRTHVDVVEIDQTITALKQYGTTGGYLSPVEAAPLLRDSGIDLDRYDHVTCAVSLNDSMGYLGLGGTSYENGTGHTCINLKNREYCLNVLRKTEKAFPPSMYVHEFLHFMENMNRKWGAEFGLHDIRINHYTPDDNNGRGCYTDILLNRARGDAGTGVHPAAWRYPPRVFRTMTELAVPSGVAAIGPYAFQNRTNLTKVTIPGSVTSIGNNAFQNCINLAEVAISSGVTSIGVWAFGCREKRTALARISIPASVTSIEYAAFYNTSLTDVYYGGTEEEWNAIQIGEYNSHLTGANIHYNSTYAEVSSVSEDGRSIALLISSDNLLADCTTVYAASYYGNGRFAGIVQGTLQGETAKFTSPVTRGGRLFFLDGDSAPVYASVGIPAA